MSNSFVTPNGLETTRLLCPWDFPGKNTEGGCHFLFQGIFPDQGSNHVSALARKFFITEPPGSPHKNDCSIAKSRLTLCDPIACSRPGFLVFHYLLEFAQVCVHWIGGAIQPSHLLPFSSSFAFSLSQHQGLLQWVSCSHQVAKILELQLQYESFQTDFF